MPWTVKGTGWFLEMSKCPRISEEWMGLIIPVVQVTERWWDWQWDPQPTLSSHMCSRMD